MCRHLSPSWSPWVLPTFSNIGSKKSSAESHFQSPIQESQFKHGGPKRMTSSEKTDRLQEIMKTLTAKGFTAVMEPDGMLFLKVGINAPLFCDVLKKIGLEAINQSPGKGPENNELWGTVRVPLRRVSDKEVFPEVIEEFCNSYAIAFDLDGTLVDS